MRGKFGCVATGRSVFDVSRRPGILSSLAQGFIARHPSSATWRYYASLLTPIVSLRSRLGNERRRDIKLHHLAAKPRLPRNQLQSGP